MAAAASSLLAVHPSTSSVFSGSRRVASDFLTAAQNASALSWYREWSPHAFFKTKPTNADVKRYCDLWVGSLLSTSAAPSGASGHTGGRGGDEEDHTIGSTPGGSTSR
ncbi:unnamed protein product, partial [Amoebophrya sp. A120]|eukprot:GSA120T00022505001.1